MPASLALTGAPSVSKRWRLSVILDGVSAATDFGTYTVVIGARADATPPADAGDLTAWIETSPLARVSFNATKSLTRRGEGDARFSYQQTVDADAFSGIAVGQYIWVGLVDTANPADAFYVLGGPLRVRA